MTSRPRSTSPDGTLESWYEARKAGYTAPEQRRVRHILIADEEGGEEARARAEDLRSRILAGEAFEDLAREFSDDPGSAGSGGDLGFGGRGIWVPPFEQAAFSLGIGELSEPVQSDFGFHLIRVEDVRESRTRAFDEVREEIEFEYRTEQAEQLYFEQVERLSNLAFEQPANLADAADELGLTVEESGHVSRRGEPGHEVLGDPAVLAAAFDEDVLAGNNSEPVEIEGYRTVVVRVDDRRGAPPAHPGRGAAGDRRRAPGGAGDGRDPRAGGGPPRPAAGRRGTRGGGRRPRVERGAHRRARRNGPRARSAGGAVQQCRARARGR